MAAAKRFQLKPDIPADLLAKYRKAGLVAVDTELQGLTLGRDNVCLTQFCDKAGNVALVPIKAPKTPPNVKALLTDPKVVKIFHYAVTDVAFLRNSLDIVVTPFECTKVMSKLVRTYTDSHGLRYLVAELAGVELDKDSQMTDWSRSDLSAKQLVYAANDVLHLIKVYEALQKMLEHRGKLPSGITAKELNKRTQAVLPTVVELIINGYGDRDGGWETSIFSH